MPQSPTAPVAHLFLRHALATIAYRGRKAVHDAPPSFAAFRPADGSRTPAEILAHIGDLFDWAIAMVEGRRFWRDSEPLQWEQEIDRFFHGLAAFDQALVETETLGMPAEILFQGPIADSLQHIGQLTYLRRLAGCPIRGESYAQAEIRIGRVGPDQAEPGMEF